MYGHELRRHHELGTKFIVRSGCSEFEAGLDVDLIEDDRLYEGFQYLDPIDTLIFSL